MALAAARTGGETGAGFSGAGPRARWRLAAGGALLLLALAGVAVAGYLAWENSQGRTGVCTIAHGCSKVQNSSYGKLLGVPVSVPGVALYVALAGLTAAWLVEYRGLTTVWLTAAFYGSLGGFLFSGYLTYLEAFVIDAWCIYCIVSASIMTVLAAAWTTLLVIELRRRRG